MQARTQMLRLDQWLATRRGGDGDIGAIQRRVDAVHRARIVQLGGHGLGLGGITRPDTHLAYIAHQAQSLQL